MASSYKAVALASELFAELKLRLSALAATSSTGFDSNGNPTITLASNATPATTQKNVFIRLLPASTIFTTSIGGTPDTFSPTVLQFATEAPSAGAGHTSDYLSPSDLVALYGCLFKRGTRVEMYQSANGTVPSVSTLVASNLQTAWENSATWGSIASQ
ncbi:MAG TPA: hypothetical protein VHD33_00655 [Legionellaceae bacterium]|nr:hypothetical protein [Legionellaceae bacterium]